MAANPPDSGGNAASGWRPELSVKRPVGWLAYSGLRSSPQLNMAFWVQV